MTHSPHISPAKEQPKLPQGGERISSADSLPVTSSPTHPSRPSVLPSLPLAWSLFTLSQLASWIFAIVGFALVTKGGPCTLSVRDNVGLSCLSFAVHHLWTGNGDSLFDGKYYSVESTNMDNNQIRARGQCLPFLSRYHGALQGSLSFWMLLVQAPGSLAIFIYFAFIERNSVTTWLGYLTAGAQQAILVVLLLSYRIRDRRRRRTISAPVSHVVSS